jgi:hypothetical protein
MSLKVWLLVLVLFLIIAISGIVSGKTTDDTSLGLGDFAWEISDFYIPVPGISTARVLTERGLPKSLYDPFWDDLGPAFISDGLKSAELAATLAGSVYWAGIAAIASFQSNMYDRYGGYSYKPSTSDSSGGKTTDLKKKLAQQGIGTPQLSSPTYMLPGDSTEGPGVSGTGKGKIEVLYLEMSFEEFGKLNWLDMKNRYSIPPVPRYLASGELNTYGYDFIYQPGSEAYRYEYRDWVKAYVASFESTAAGVGTLLDEGQNGGGGW